MVKIYNILSSTFFISLHLVNILPISSRFLPSTPLTQWTIYRPLLTACPVRSPARANRRAISISATTMPTLKRCCSSANVPGVLAHPRPSISRISLSASDRQVRSCGRILAASSTPAGIGRWTRAEYWRVSPVSAATHAPCSPRAPRPARNANFCRIECTSPSRALFCAASKSCIIGYYKRRWTS